MRVTHIMWDTDGDEEILHQLPEEIELPEELTTGNIDYDGIDEYLTSKTGFCYFGYVLE